MKIKTLKTIRKWPLFDLVLQEIKDKVLGDKTWKAYVNKQGVRIAVRHKNKRPALVRIIEKHGIVCEPINGWNHCTMGFSEAEQRWYGWTHRGMAYFEVGSTVKFGDTAFTPRNPTEFRKQMINFWSDPGNLNVKGKFASEDGVKGVYISWDIEELNQTSGAFHPYPKFGNGEWAAKNLKDAKQMALDFVEGCS